MRQISEMSDTPYAARDYSRLEVGPVFSGNRIVRQAFVGVKRAPVVTVKSSEGCLQAVWRRRYGYQ